MLASLTPFIRMMSLSIAGFLLSSQLVAQDVKGTVQLDDGSPAAFATVALFQPDTAVMVKAAATDIDGVFHLLGVPAGTYAMEVDYIGYDASRSTVVVKEGVPLDLGTVVLSPGAEQIDEVTVKAKRPLVEIKADKTVFNVAGSINAQGANALELLRKAPGVMLDNEDNIMLSGKSGVIVYIDGKPSPLTAADLASYLNGLTSEAIDNIEIITNPSSKYEAEGNAGIINIVLKKNKNLGTNGSISAGWSQARSTSANTGIQLNHRTAKANVFGSYNFAHVENESWMEFERFLGNIFTDQDSELYNEMNSHVYKAGVDYFVSAKSTIGLLVNGSLGNGINHNDATSDIFNDALNPVEPDQRLIAGNDIDRDRDNINVNLNYALVDREKSTKFNVDLDYGRYNSQSISRQPNRYFDPKTNALLDDIYYETDAESVIDIYTTKLDYERPLLGGVFATGLKGSFIDTDNDFLFYNEDESGALVIDDERTNRFLYTEMVYAGYVNYQWGKEKWNYQLGLRVEHTENEGDLRSRNNTDEKNDQSYTDWFPSGGVTYTPNQKHSLRLSYSRRLNRPNYQDLNPFEFRLDELSFQKGNPFLTPEYTHNVQLGHTFNYSLNTTLSLSYTSDLISRLTDTETGNETFLTWENIAEQYAYSLTVSYPFSITEWWSTYWNVGLNHINNESDPDDERFSNDKSIDLNVNFYSIFGQQTIKLPKGFNVEISGFYNSPSVWGANFETENYWNIDFGVQKRFLDDKLSVKMSVSDIFRGQEWEAKNRFGDLAIMGGGGYESRRFRLNMTYNFGNDRIKSRRRKTGIEDEQRRANGGGGGGGGF